MSEKDGGPAFPQTTVVDPTGSWVTVERGAVGLSLRDWFAGQAITGILADNEEYGPTVQEAAETAYKIADAMLKARTREPRHLVSDVARLMARGTRREGVSDGKAKARTVPTPKLAPLHVAELHTPDDCGASPVRQPRRQPETRTLQAEQRRDIEAEDGAKASRRLKRCQRLA